MRVILSICISMMIAAPVMAAVAKEKEKERAPALRAYLIFGTNDFQEVWITSSNGTTFTYRETEKGEDDHEIAASKADSIYFFEPPEFTAAMDCYRGRKYVEAKEKFSALKKTWEAVRGLSDNPATLAAFYELECYRQLDDLEGLAKGLQGFRNKGLTRETHLRQLELYMFWDALRAKDWPRLETLASERANEKLPGGQRAQVAYCHGVALENLGRLNEALDAYQTAITADGGACEMSARQSVLNSLRIYKADPDIQTAIRRWGSADENLDASGRRRLVEAGALARVFESLPGTGQSLPGPFKEFLKYAPALPKPTP